MALCIKELTEHELESAPIITDEDYVVSEAIKKYLLHMSKNNVESLKLLGYMTDDEKITNHALSLQNVAFSKNYTVISESLFNSLFKD